tara:strand:- start:536 stop:868 length:333 start_codon:yes stop_codon:yes gene_type:complete
MITRTNKKKEVWLGLIEISGDPDNSILDGCCGGFSNFLIYADSSSIFEKFVEVSAANLSLKVEKIIWSESLSTRLKNFDIDNYLLKLAAELDPKVDEGVWGEFHVWEENE